MKLHDDSIVPEALQETVAMEDWYRDQLSAVVQRFYTIARGEGAVLVNTAVEPLHADIHSLPFDEITSPAFFDRIGMSDLYEAFQPIAQLVTSVEQVTPNQPEDIRVLRSAMEILIHSEDETAKYRQSIERGVMESAVKQALKKRGIDVPEHKRLQDTTDADIFLEMDRIAGLVHERVRELMQL